MDESNLIINKYERKFIASSKLFWGYTQIYDIRLYDNIEDIDNSQIIFNFIKESKIEYSKNINGIYFNLSCIGENIINDFYNLIFLIKNNESEQEIYSKRCDEYVNIINNDKLTEKKEKIPEKYTEIKLNKLQKEILNTIN